MVKRKISVIIATVLTIAMATGCTLFGEDYVAKVGSDKVTTSEYKFFLKNAEKQFESLYGSTTPVDWTSKYQNTTLAEYAKQIALESAVELKIQLSKTKAENLSLTKEETDNLNTDIDSSVKQFGTTGLEQEKGLKEQAGVNVKELKNVYSEIKLVQKYASKIKTGLKYTDADLKAYYDNQKKAGTELVWHILISTKDAEGKDFTQAKIDEAKKKAEDILAKVNSGAKFSDLVTQYTEDPGSKETGGEYSITKGQMVKEFENWTFKAKEGETGIVITDYGFHIMKKPTFEDVKNTTIKSGYENKTYADELAKWKKESGYKVTKNSKVLDGIKVPLAAE